MTLYTVLEEIRSVIWGFNTRHVYKYCTNFNYVGHTYLKFVHNIFRCHMSWVANLRLAAWLPYMQLASYLKKTNIYLSTIKNNKIIKIINVFITILIFDIIVFIHVALERLHVGHPCNMLWFRFNLSGCHYHTSLTCTTH